MNRETESLREQQKQAILLSIQQTLPEGDPMRERLTELVEGAFNEEGNQAKQAETEQEPVAHKATAEEEKEKREKEMVQELVDRWNSIYESLRRRHEIMYRIREDFEKQGWKARRFFNGGFYVFEHPNIDKLVLLPGIGELASFNNAYLYHLPNGEVTDRVSYNSGFIYKGVRQPAYIEKNTMKGWQGVKKEEYLLDSDPERTERTLDTMLHVQAGAGKELIQGEADIIEEQNAY